MGASAPIVVGISLVSTEHLKCAEITINCSIVRDDNVLMCEVT